jgi:hypothetical protein
MDEPKGGEATEAQRRGALKWRMATTVIARESASDLARGDCASELGPPFGKTARKIAAPW